MKFEEKKAAEIIEKFNLSKSTLRVWEHRGKIPKKYFNPDFDNSEKINKVKLDRLIKLLLNEKLNLSELSRTADIDKSKLSDVIRGKSKNITEKEFVRIKRRINEIRIELKKLDKTYLSERVLEDVMKVLQIPELVVSIAFNKKWLDYRSTKRVAITQEDYDFLRDRIMIMLLELSL